MSEKRGRIRKRKRLKLRFGQGQPQRMAFTEDISERGVFITTGQPERPGQKLLIEIYLSENDTVLVHGRVQWAKKVPPNLLQVAKKGGMGVRLLQFVSGEQAFKSLLAELRH